MTDINVPVDWYGAKNPSNHFPSDIVAYSGLETERILRDKIFPMITTPLVRCCVDIGAYDGLEGSQTAWLVRHCGWTGHFIEEGEGANLIEGNYKGYPIVAHRTLVTSENVNSLLPAEFDYLSIDIDGNDLWIWRAIKSRPAVVIIEFNSHRQGEWEVPYTPNFNIYAMPQDQYYYGASVARVLKVGEELGYVPLAIDCMNIFFADRERLPSPYYSLVEELAV